jgi:hypothetical protein
MERFRENFAKAACYFSLNPKNQRGQVSTFDSAAKPLEPEKGHEKYHQNTLIKNKEGL